MIDSKGWLDISANICSGMAHWPDNPPVEVSTVFSFDRGDVCNLSALHMGLHTGTHVDAPKHFLKDGLPMSIMPWEAMLGAARVVEISDPTAISAKELKTKDLKKGQRILFKTTNSLKRWPLNKFQEDFVYIAHDAADYLAETGVQTVAVDYLSVGGYKNDCVETHQALLNGGVWIIEAVDLSKVEVGDYELICLPLRLDQAEAAPARVLIRPINI